MLTKNVFESNPVTFVQELETLIKDGWTVCYDDRAPAQVGWSLVAWLEKEEDEEIHVATPQKAPVGRPKINK